MLVIPSKPSLLHLYRGRVKHDADGGTERTGREVVAELSADDTRVAVNASDLAPHDSDLGATDLLRGAVDEGDLLSEVEAAGLGVVDTLNLDQAGVGVGVALASLVAEVTSLDVEAVTLLGWHLVSIWRVSSCVVARMSDSLVRVPRRVGWGARRPL